mmetsp:Transcript_38729/g.101197  ORF Transcript_38729/g.101197 Transcript_38729/m.101197 type:complete len:809 (-) Transcript_38729:67-2493(-)
MVSGVVVSLDFGLTRIRATINAGGGSVTALGGDDGIPAVVGFGSQQLTVGAGAVQQWAINSANTVSGVKALLGFAFDAPPAVKEKQWRSPMMKRSEPSGRTVFSLQARGGREVFVEEVCSLMFRELRKRAEFHVQSSMDAMLAVPSNWGDAHRNALTVAARLAGFGVLRLVHAPVAAFAAHAAAARRQGRTLSVDWGASGFDIAAVELRNNQHLRTTQVVTQGLGWADAGGDAIDVRLMDMCLRRLEHEGRCRMEQVLGNPSASRSLRAAVESAKVALSSRLTTVISVPQLLPGVDLSVAISNQDLQDLVAPFLDAMAAAVIRVVDEARWRGLVDCVVFTGDTLRAPWAQEALRAAISHAVGHAPPMEMLPPFAISSGCAALASASSGLVLMDVVPFFVSYDCDQAGINDQQMWPKLASAPAQCSHEFFTTQDHQTHIEVRIMGASHSHVVRSHHDTVYFSHLPSGPRGSVVVHANFTMSESGLLTVSASSSVGGSRNMLQARVHRAARLPEDAINDMVQRIGEILAAYNSWQHPPQHGVESGLVQPQRPPPTAAAYVPSDPARSTVEVAPQPAPQLAVRSRPAGLWPPPPVVDLEPKPDDPRLQECTDAEWRAVTLKMLTLEKSLEIGNEKLVELESELLSRPVEQVEFGRVKTDLAQLETKLGKSQGDIDGIQASQLVSGAEVAKDMKKALTKDVAALLDRVENLFDVLKADIIVQWAPRVQAEMNELRGIEERCETLENESRPPAEISRSLLASTDSLLFRLDSMQLPGIADGPHPATLSSCIRSFKSHVTRRVRRLMNALEAVA